jgi:hypothetical protein
MPQVEQTHYAEQTRTLLKEATRSRLSICGRHLKALIQALTLFILLKPPNSKEMGKSSVIFLQFAYK